ncbi:MAG: YqaA family protein [Fidelibacterota bacterium]
MFSWLKSSLILLISRYGYGGIFLLSLTSAIYQPVGPDIFIVGEGGLGFNPYIAALIALTGTIIGVSIAYIFGVYLGYPLMARLFKKRISIVNRAEDLVKKYGIWGVAIGAFSPVPLTQICWLAGIFKMPLAKYYLALLIGLVPRFFIEAIFGQALGGFLVKYL